MLDNKQDQPFKFRIKYWVEINDESRGIYNTGSNIKLKTAMLRSSLCDFADAYIFVMGTIIITEVGNNTAARQANETNKGVIFKNCVTFIKFISKINDTEIDNA